MAEGSSVGYKKLHKELWQDISKQIIDEDQLNEIDMGFITNFVAVAPTLSNFIIRNAVKKARQEATQTERMVDVMKKRINDQPVTPQETKVMRDQFRDLVSYGVIALGSVLAAASAGPLAGTGIALAALYKKELVDLIRNQGPEVIINLLKTRGNIDVINQLMLKFFDRNLSENFADGKNPGRKGLSRRVGIPKKATLGQLEKIAKSSTGERRRMAQWQLNMRRGRNKKK